MNIERMQRLTRDLIKIDSTSGREHEITTFLDVHLQQLGLLTSAFEVTKGRRNLLATWADAAPPSILFNTHIDTVSGHYGPFEDALRIYGRGACDTHGVLAAQIEALLDLCAEGRRDVGLLLVVGEETSHDGARAVRQHDVQEPAVLIVGEPTENCMMKSQKGRLKADLLVVGREGHSGYPEKFDSAVEKLVFFLNRLWQAPWLTKNSEAGTTVNTTILERSGPDNQIPGSAKIRLMFRCAEPVEKVKRKVELLLREVSDALTAKGPAQSHFEVTWDPAMNDPISNLAVLPGFEVGAAAYNTDIAYFGWPHSRTFLLGPGSILQAHRDLRNDDWMSAEWILKDEQIKGVELYKRLVKRL